MSSLPASYFTFVIFMGCFVAGAQAGPPTAEQLEFFEKEIRPVLADHCYPCHSAQALSPFAGLRLDSREAALEGGESGPAVVPGKPEESPLVQRIQGKPVLMPPGGALDQHQIDALARWVEMGAPWTTDTPVELAAASDFNLEERKRSHWVWQPVRPSSPPRVRDQDWPRGTTDRFLLARLEKNGLEPAPAADRNTLIRRLSFDLRGLPPLSGEIQAFVADTSPEAFEKLVDDFLDSPHFGERWARHWMDLVRYSESHGSEGDPDTPFAWRYRDYLIRALNQDVPYDQLIREHLAGDLLPNPRIDEALGINESLLATAQLRLVEHGYQPVDPWEDRIKWTDNQIDVVSKAFQGLTVTCARCHDHKFDAISQRDYYALFGTFYGARPTQRAIDTPERLNTNRDQLLELKQQIRAGLAEAWILEARSLGTQLLEAKRKGGKTRVAPCPPENLSDKADESDSEKVPEKAAKTGDTGSESPPVERTAAAALSAALGRAPCEPDNPLYAWSKLGDKRGSRFRRGWKKLIQESHAVSRERDAFNSTNFSTAWDLTGPDYQSWISHGVGASFGASKPGEFSLLSEGKRVLEGIYPAGVYTHLLSSKHSGVIQSPRFRIDTDNVSLRVLGGGLSSAQLIVENYAVPRGGIYDMRYSPQADQMAWFRWDTAYWKGFTGYIELATRFDVTTSQSGDLAESDQARSAMGASRIVFHNLKEKPSETSAPILHLLQGSNTDSSGQLAHLIRDKLLQAIVAWRDGTASGNQVEYLDYFVRADLLARSRVRLRAIDPLLAEYRALEAEIPIPRRAPGVLEESAPDHPLLRRGNHRDPKEPVPRRFLTALGGTPYRDPRLVRLRLADEIISSDNPLTARVMVNRIWRYLFGYGLVRTTDNFGKLGDQPTHPELLDYLADRFIRSGYSIKAMVRLLATSEAYRMNSRASLEAEQLDPSNKLHQHANVRRLDAEEIRDSMLSISGRLEPSLYGPSIPVHHTIGKSKSKGLKEAGPLDGAGRRSIYQEIRRNSHNPFLEVFDLPKPASTRGQRDITNVPSQSLTLLNSPFVIGQAAQWGKHLAAGESNSVESRIQHMFFKALGRWPSGDERERTASYLGSLVNEHETPERHILADASVWKDLAHAIFNLKQFIYIQ